MPCAGPQVLLGNLPLRGEDRIDVGLCGGIGGQQDRVANDIEGQLSGLGTEQLGFQERGPLLLQQLFTAHIILDAQAEFTRGFSQLSASPPACPRPYPTAIGRSVLNPPLPSPHWLV